MYPVKYNSMIIIRAKPKLPNLYSFTKYLCDTCQDYRIIYPIVINLIYKMKCKYTTSKNKNKKIMKNTVEGGHGDKWKEFSFIFI